MGYQSDDQKEFARQSREGAQCQEQTQQGRKLTEECKVSRQHASSLDRIVASVRLPKTVTQNIYLKTISELSQAYVAPYITELRYKEPEEETDRGYSQYDCNIKMDPQGKKFSVSVEGGESNLVIEEIRVEESLQGLLPINMKESGAQNIIQHGTSRQAPSTCSIEDGKVKTFDNLEYDYQLNDCEHVVFKDCSESSRVEVSVQQQSSKKTVKVTIDNHQYELKVPTSSGSQQAVIKVNGEEKSNIK